MKTSKVNIGKGFWVDKATLDRYWLHISDRLEAKKYREVSEIQTLEDERGELHRAVIASAGFDPQDRFKGDKYKSPKTKFWRFIDTLDTYIAMQLAKERNIDALNRQILNG